MLPTSKLAFAQKEPEQGRPSASLAPSPDALHPHPWGAAGSLRASLSLSPAHGTEGVLHPQLFRTAVVSNICSCLPIWNLENILIAITLLNRNFTYNISQKTSHDNQTSSCEERDKVPTATQCP